MQAVDLEPLADGRHAAEVRQQVAADGLEPFALDLDASRCATSSMLTLPLNTKRPLPSSTIGSDSTSYSSRISPTISSSRSSIVTSPAVPPYSSTTIAHLRLLALELLQQLGHALGLRHDDRRPQQRRDRPRVVGGARARPGPSRRRSRRCCRGCPCRPGTREYSCSRNSARRSPTVASSRMATMSGRGVITSRTSVSPKSTMLCSSRRSSPSMMPFLLRGVDVGLRAPRWPPRAASSGVGGGPPRLVREHERARSSASAGRAPARSARTSAAAARARARDRGRRSAAAAAARRRRRTPRAPAASDGSVCAPSMPIAAREQRRRRAGDQAEQQPHRDEQQQRIVEVRAERARTVAALGHQAQRQPHQRAEGRLDRAEVDRGAREQEDDAAESSRRARSISPSRRPPLRRSRRSTRAIRPSSRS